MSFFLTLLLPKRGELPLAVSAAALAVVGESMEDPPVGRASPARPPTSIGMLREGGRGEAKGRGA